MEAEKRDPGNKVFSRDVTAAMLLYQNNRTAAAMLMYPTNSLGIELYYHRKKAHSMSSFEELFVYW